MQFGFVLGPASFAAAAIASAVLLSWRIDTSRTKALLAQALAVAAAATVVATVRHFGSSNFLLGPVPAQAEASVVAGIAIFGFALSAPVAWFGQGPRSSKALPIATAVTSTLLLLLTIVLLILTIRLQHAPLGNDLLAEVLKLEASDNPEIDHRSYLAPMLAAAGDEQGARRFGHIDGPPNPGPIDLSGIQIQHRLQRLLPARPPLCCRNTRRR